MKMCLGMFAIYEIKTPKKIQSNITFYIPYDKKVSDMDTALQCAGFENCQCANDFQNQDIFSKFGVACLPLNCKAFYVFYLRVNLNTY